MAEISGEPCPRCGEDELAEITSESVVHIVELKCSWCGYVWAVEL